MSALIQEFIHKFEEGSGARIFRLVFVLVAVLATAGLYDMLCYRNLYHREAMDMAQVGKNIAEGKGYSTLFVRPFSMFLLRKHRPDQSPEVKTIHPDLANPPVYPYVLAGLFKLLPEKFFSPRPGGFFYYKPDLAITVLNQFLLLLAGVLLFLLADKLFDSTMAWVTAITFVGTEALWRYSVSGLNTMLLIVILLAVAWCLVLLEHGVRFAWSDGAQLALAGAAGLLIGLGGLTRYAFAWLIVPLGVYLIVFHAAKRTQMLLAALAGFALLMAPWIGRNFSVSGTPFGTSTFAVMQGTGNFTEDRLERSLHPNIRAFTSGDLTRKLLQNSREVFQEVPRLGGSWVSAFFLAGLLVPFRNSGTARLRWFVVLCVGMLGCVQALCRGSSPVDAPDYAADNQLVLATPLVLMFGAALFVSLLDSITLPFPAARFVMLAVFCVVGSFPLIHSLLPPRSGTSTYPPYAPPQLQEIGTWYEEKEMMMSDMPWAVAWYSRRQCVWLTLNWKEDFVEITDLHKPIKALYLTTLTTDSRFLTGWVKGQDKSWTAFMLESMLQKQVPTGFPLRRSPDRKWWPEQLFLTDYDRWKLKKE